MSNFSKTFGVHWMLAILAVGVGFAPEVVLCISTGHVTLETSSCCVPGTVNSTVGTADVQFPTGLSDPCSPCADVPLETGAVGRLSLQFGVGELLETAPATSWFSVDRFEPSLALTATVPASARAPSKPRPQQSVILLI